MPRKVIKESQELKNEFLKRIYQDKNSETFFSSSRGLHDYTKKLNKKITLKDIKNFLQKQETYSLFKNRYTTSRSKFVSSEIDRFWCGDLIDFGNLAKFNIGFKYALIVVDILSKYLWIEVLKNKKPSSIISAFKKILKDKRKCKILITDAGREFNNKFFEKFLRENNIKLYIMRNTEIKAAPVERVIRTIKDKLFRYLHFSKSKKYIDILPFIVKNYNNSVHSTTKFRPVNVSESNKWEAFLNSHTKRIKTKKSLFKVGDYVRILNIKSKFRKGHTTNWTRETFKIVDKLKTLPLTRYQVEDKKGEKIIGSFYDFELSRAV